MGKFQNLGCMVVERLVQDYIIEQTDIGEDACLSKNGMVFLTESYDIEGLGHLCVLKMHAMLGLMQMETVILAPSEKDVPLINLDWVKAFGKETQIVELYDTQLEPYPESYLTAFDKIKERDESLADYTSGGDHWYDSILYECSYHKTGKNASYQLARAARDYFYTYAEQLRQGPECDKAAKEAKVREFAETLFSQGGPAVDQVKKLFGDETSYRLILRHMYGAEK